jgi:para-nitrobenzyl esterase
MAHLNRRNFLQRASMLSSGAAMAGPAGAGSEAIAETAQGKVRGRAIDGIKIFLGVPYGGPTAGRRWMPASKAGPWPGVRDALEYGPRSPFVDTHSRTSELIHWDSPPGNESDDCLVLNVWTPGLKDGRKRPVMFWLHGGGFSTGSGSHASNDGTRLARRGDVVVVTINHRIGFLGYLNLAQLGGSPYADSGNVGMLDAVLALEWVRDNIGNFGGDPGRVMIFGESGGGAKVCTLLAMPAAKGLFHRAAIESGPALRSSTPEAATKSAELFIAELGLDKTRLDELQKLPLERLKAAQAALDKRHSPIRWGPVVDGKALPRHPFDPDAPEVSADVPILIGNNKTEATFFLLNEIDKIYAFDDQALEARVKQTAGNDSDRLIAAYRRLYPKASPGELYFHISTDSGMWIGSVTLAERKAAQQRAPVYMYVFDWETPVMNGKLKSPHGLEVSFVFDNVGQGGKFIGDGADRFPLAAKMSGAWIAFARHGDPNTKDLPRWDPYTPENRATMLFDNNSHVVKDPWSEARLIFEASKPRRI